MSGPPASPFELTGRVSGSSFSSVWSAHQSLQRRQKALPGEGFPGAGGFFTAAGSHPQFPVLSPKMLLSTCRVLPDVLAGGRWSAPAWALVGVMG